MFSKTLLVFVTLFLSAFIAQAVPVEPVDNALSSSGNKGRSNSGNHHGSKASTTAAASSAATAAGHHHKSGNSRHGSKGSTTAAVASATTASGKGGQGGDNNGAVSSTAAAPPAASSSVGNASNSTNDPQTSLTLDPAVLCKGFENNGQDVPTAGQVPSATSSNNFMNFCLTVPQLPLTNGKQIATGSCNPAPMGVIPSKANIPSAKFTFPKNFGTVKANTAFTISLAIQNFEPGFFVNAQENYFSAPQQLNGQGQIQGHSHVVVEAITSLTQTTPTDPTKFAFFKGMNDPAVNGLLTAAVTAGLPVGTYRLASINTAANHQPVLVPIAQHGSVDDFVYFTVTDSGAAAGGATAAAAGAASNSVTASSAAGATSTVSSASSTAATGKGKPPASTSSAPTVSVTRNVKATPVPPVAQAPASTSSAAPKGSGKK